MKTEIVVIDGWYAVRRTRFFWPFTEYKFFHFSNNPNSGSWEPRTAQWFSGCLTKELEVAKKALAFHGSNMGVPYTGDLISPTQFSEMLRMAETDEGMKDCLLKAKEFYLLKKK